MSEIQNIPYASRKHIDQLQTGRELLPIWPSVVTGRHYDASVTGTAESATFDGAPALLGFYANGFVIGRFLSATDTAAVTSSNFDFSVPGYSKEPIAVPSGKTGYSYLTPDGVTVLIAVLEY